MNKILTILVVLCISLRVTGVNISTFGAVPDGTTDNYYAFKLAAAYASANPNTTINFAAGTYYIAKYRTVKNDTIDHIKWNNCTGLKLIGVTGTIISVNGNFFRPLDYVLGGGAKKSYTSGLCPFYFFHCVDLEIRNIEITGNVQSTTRAPGIDANNPSVTESNNILLRFIKCDTVVIDNMYLHHAESDGITISGDRVNCDWINSTEFTVTNTRSYNNGRNGMSAGGLSNGYFYNCKFNYSGFTDGTYGHNDPAAGVDLEPGPYHFISNVKFESCSFDSCYGSFLTASYPETNDGLILLKCSSLNGATPSYKPQGITILSKNAVIDSCIIDLGNKSLKFTNPSNPGSQVTLKHSTITSAGNPITSVLNGMEDSIIISDNFFIYTSSTITVPIINLATANLRFLNNDIYISEAALDSKPTGNHCQIFNALESSGNLFHSLNPLNKPRVGYTGTIIVADL